MAFKNMRLTQQERDTLINSNIIINGRPLTALTWTVDKERNMFLISRGSTNLEKPDLHIFYFNINNIGYLIKLELNTEEDEKNIVLKWFNFEIISVTDNNVNENTEMKKYLKEALQVFGLFRIQQVKKLKYKWSF